MIIFLENTFIKKCEELSINNECLSFIHVNIRSIPKNLCSFLHYIDMLNLNFTVIGMSETWLYDANVHCFGIESYNHFFQYRKERRGGGVSLFIHKKLSAKCREDLNVKQSFMEAIFVEIPKMKLVQINVSLLEQYTGHLIRMFLFLQIA